MRLRKYAHLWTGLALMPYVAAAQTAPRRHSEQDALAVVHQFNAARRNYDVPALDRVLTPEYVEISPLGELDPREKVLGFYKPKLRKPEDPRLETDTLEATTIHLYANEFATIVGQLVFRIVMPDGARSDRRFAVSYLLRVVDGEFRVAIAQFTGIREVPAPRRE